MDHAIRGLVGHAFDRAIKILNRNRSVHEKTANSLLQKETLEDDDIAALREQIVPAEALDVSPDAPPSPRLRQLQGRPLCSIKIQMGFNWNFAPWH